MVLFEGPIKNNNIDGAINSFFNKNFLREPSGPSPLIIPSNIHEPKGLASVLPQRKSGSFVWTQIDTEREVEKMFIRDYISTEMKALSQLANNWLGFNIIEKAEHLGNIYLTAPNPYYRDLDITLSSEPVGIFYQFHMRKGVKEKLKLRIIDKHGDNIALDKIYSINDYIGIRELPHEPQSIELRVYNSKDELIGGQGPFSFLKSIQLNMSVKQADLHVKVENEKGSKEFTVEKYSKEKPSVIGDKSDFNAAYYFKEAENKRKHITNKENFIFVFLKGTKGNNQKEKVDQQKEAQTIIRNLINQAQFRCFICDPYFGVNDLIDFAFYIENTGVQLNILNAKEYIDKNMAKKLTEATKEYNLKPFQKIVCRILKGNKSILHDRFIISDNNVWFIGTSLNQIGTKATCICKVPESDNLEIIREIENWFFNKDGNYTEIIDEYAD